MSWLQLRLRHCAASSLKSFGTRFKRFSRFHTGWSASAHIEALRFTTIRLRRFPDATLAALDALGPNVQTLLLGGHERNLDFSALGAQLPENIKTVILFPVTGVRIWQAIEANSRHPALPEAFFVREMEQAVKIAYQKTSESKICLLSPASPSFGMFKDYRERGDLFKAFVRKLSSS